MRGEDLPRIPLASSPMTRHVPPQRAPPQGSAIRLTLYLATGIFAFCGCAMFAIFEATEVTSPRTPEPVAEPASAVGAQVRAHVAPPSPLASRSPSAPQPPAPPAATPPAAPPLGVAVVPAAAALPPGPPPAAGAPGARPTSAAPAAESEVAPGTAHEEEQRTEVSTPPALPVPEEGHAVD